MTPDKPRLDCTDENLSPGRRRLIGWLQLVRLPNLLTVPGDPLVGYLLVCQPSEHSLVTALSVIGISLLLYMGGLILNDVADIYEDCVKCPKRPLPSQTIRKGHAVIVMLCLFAPAVILSASLGVRVLMTALVLLALVLAYNLGGKKIRFLGEAMMGSCRGASVMLGAMAATGDPVQAGLAALTITLYIMAVTWLARYEHDRINVRTQAWIPGAVLLAGVIPSVLLYRGGHLLLSFIGAGVLVFAGVQAGLIGRRMTGDAVSIPSAVGQWLRLLIISQLAFSLMAPVSLLLCVSVVFLALACYFNLKLARCFYAS